MQFTPDKFLVAFNPEQILGLPLFNIRFDAGQGGHIRRLRDRSIVFEITAPIQTTAQYIAAHYTQNDISNVINRLVDHVLAGKLPAATAAGTIHEVFTANPRILKGAMIKEYLNNPLRGHEDHLTTLVARSGLGTVPHSVVLYFWHMALTLLNKRVLTYVAPVYEAALLIEDWDAVAPFFYKSPFRSNNMYSGDDVQVILVGEQMVDQMDGRNFESWMEVMTRVAVAIGNMNEHDYTGQALLYIPEQEVWYMHGNAAAYVYSGDRVTIGFDTFKFSKKEAVAHFSSFANSIIKGFLQNFSFKGLEQSFEAKTEVTITKKVIEIKALFGIMGMNTHLNNLQPVPAMMDYYHPRTWYRQKISDGKDLLYVTNLTDAQLREGVLKIKIDSVQPVLKTAESQFTVAVPVLDLPFMGDDASVLFDETGAHRQLMDFNTTIDINTTVQIPIERPTFNASFIDIAEVPSSWVFDQTLVDWLPAGINLNEVRAQYGVDLETLKRIINYYITSYIAISALETDYAITGKSNVGTGNDLGANDAYTPIYALTPIQFDEWRNKVVHSNLVDFIIYMINQENY